MTTTNERIGITAEQREALTVLEEKHRAVSILDDARDALELEFEQSRGTAGRLVREALRLLTEAKRYAEIGLDYQSIEDQDEFR